VATIAGFGTVSEQWDKKAGILSLEAEKYLAVSW
jgi:hypothetical protein